MSSLLSEAKGKTRTPDAAIEVESSLSDRDSESFEEEVTQGYLDSLLEKARNNARAKLAERNARIQQNTGTEEDILVLDNETHLPLPPMNPGVLPPLYFQVGESRLDGPSHIRDPGAEQAERASSSLLVPAPPIPPPELTKSGKPLTKKQKKELKRQTAGPDWFDMPAPSEADLPRIYREVEALRLRNHLDPKRFYRKDEGEGKGMKGLPKYIAIGTILPSNTPFGTATADNLPKSHRKRTLVDELVDDDEAKRYAKKKFEDLQTVRGARGRNTLHAKKAMRKPKF